MIYQGLYLCLEITITGESNPSLTVSAVEKRQLVSRTPKLADYCHLIKVERAEDSTSTKSESVRDEPSETYFMICVLRSQ